MNHLIAFVSQIVVSQIVIAWDIKTILIAVVIIAGAFAIVGIILNKLNKRPPDWFVNILWVVLAVIVGVVALKFIFSLL